MSKQSKGGSGNMLLLAGLSVGAFMLFANKGNAQSKAAEAPAGADASSEGSSDADIPAAPRILAVNNSSSESPTPTGIVSDEEGMEATSSTAPQSSTQSRTAPSQTQASGDEDEEEGSGTSPIPPLISTTLTPKEKAIINRGQLTNDLAIQRPDLYRAIYIRKHGGNGNSQKALQQADAQITRIQANGTTKATPVQKKRRRVTIRLHPQAGQMVRTAQAGVSRTAVKPTRPALHTSAGKPVVRPGSKKAHPQKKTVPHPAHKHAATAHKGTVRKRR